MFRRESDIERFKICMFDMICAIVAYYITFLLPFHELTEYSLVLISIVHVAIFYIGNQFNHLYQRGYLDEVKSVITYEIQMMIALMVMIFITKGAFNISRRGMACFIVLDTILVYLEHIAVKMYRHKVYPERESSKKVYLITSLSRLERVVNRIQLAGAWGGKLTAIYLVDQKENPIKSYLDIPVVTTENDYYEYAKQQVVDEVFINLPSKYEFDMEGMVQDFEAMGIPVSFNINAFDLDTKSDKRVRKLGGFSVITFSTQFHDYSSLLMKRFIDICGAVVGLILTTVVGIILVPIIKLESKGPAIFSQERVGKNGRVFKFYKFRSMYIDAEERKAELMEQNEMNGLMFKMENDPRITKVGKFIRKTSLDELPQFYNVLRGDMSLVGTRPPTVDEYRQYEAHHKRRLCAKPGITGMWQVSGRSDITDFDEVIRLDFEYIDNWSVWMDIKILLKTIKVIVFGSGAR